MHVKCRYYESIPDPKRRTSQLLKDVGCLIRRINDILTFAGTHKWTPSGISELNFITIFINEMVHLVDNIIKEERRDYLEVIQPALASFFASSFELVVKLIKIRPKITKTCPPSAH